MKHKLRYWGRRPNGAGGNWSIWLPAYDRWSHSMSNPRSCILMFSSLNHRKV